MKSQIPAGYWGLITADQDRYAYLQGLGWAATEVANSVIPAPGTLRNLRIRLVDGGGAPEPPGAGKHHIFIIRRNGADTNLVVTISDLETEGDDLTHEVSVSPGDVVTLRYAYDADSGVNCYARWVCEFEGNVANESIILGGGSLYQYYLDKFDYWVGLESDLTEDNVRQICAVAGVIKNLYIILNRSSDPGGSKGHIFTLRKNGADTSLTVEITGDDTTGSDTVHEVSVSPGDIITIGQVRTAGNVDRNVIAYISTSFVATIDGEAPWPSGGNTPLDTGQITYKYLAYHKGIWDTSAFKSKQYAMPCYLDWLYVQVSAAPGAGKSWVFTVMKNGTATDLWVIITGTDTLSYKSVDPELRVDLGDELTLRCEPSGTPTAAIAFGGVRSLWRTVALAEVETKSATSIAAENATWKATLNGELIDDGDQDCEVRFQYGLDTSYGTDTSWVSQAEGDFSKIITGLAANTIYHFRAQAKNGSGTVSGVDMEFGTYEQVYPTLGLTRVTGLIHRWSPGNYTLEVTLGGVMAEFGMPQFTIAPVPSMPTPPPPPPGPIPPDIPPPVVITCPPGYKMTYDYFDIYSQHPYCVPDWEEPPVPEPPPINFQYCQQLMQQLEQGRQVYMRTYYVYISIEDYARHVGQLSEYLACRILMG